MVVLPRISRVTTSRAFLSAAAAAMMPASSVEVIRFALCIVPIGPVQAVREDERGDRVGDQPVQRLSPATAAAYLGCADVRGFDAQQLGALRWESEFIELRGAEW